MSVAIPSLRAAVAVPGWAKNALWRSARAIPSLDLRFADNKSLTDAVTGASLITFTRASSGTFVGSDGVLQTAATDVPRLDHNPTTGESLGLLVEEQRTNLLTNSEDAAARWPTKDSVTVSANTTDAPNGTVTADSCVETATLGDHYLQLAITQAANITLSYSVFLKVLGSNRDVFLTMYANSFADSSSAQFLLSTATVASVTKNGTGAVPTASIQQFANGWLRLSISGQPTTAAVTDLALRIQLINASTTYTGDGTSGLFLWGAQLEVGALPTSYIPTTTAAATRSADVASITGTAFTGWYNQTEGTLFAELLVRNPANHGQVGFDDGATERWRIGYIGTGTESSNMVVVNNGVVQTNQATSSPNTWPVGASRRAAAAYKLNDMAMSLQGAEAIVDNAATVPTPVKMTIGAAETVTQMTGTIRRLTYWGQRLPNNILQGITQ